MSEETEPIGAVEPEEIEWVTDDTSNIEYLGAMYYAMCIVESANPMTKTDEARCNRIRRKALRITDKLIGEIYADFFDDDDKEE
jgi:hypothetical protein